MNADYIEYDYSYIQTEFTDEGDVKAIGYIDAFPMSRYGEQVADGYTVAKVILSTHNDVIVIWTTGEGRLNPNVIKLVEQAKIEIQEYI